MSKLFNAVAKESSDLDYLPKNTYDFKDGDALFEKEEGLFIAAEALVDRWSCLESLIENISNIPAEEASPALARVVQSQIRLIDENETGLALEGLEDVTDVTAKGDRWEKTKSHAAKAAQTVWNAAKAVISAIIEFLQNIYDWIFTSNRSVSEKLDEQSKKLSAGPASAEISSNRYTKPLTYKDDFSPQTAANCVLRYSEVLASSTHAIQDVIVFTSSFKLTNFKPDAIHDFKEHFVSRTAGGIEWKGNAVRRVGTVYDGEGGMNVSIQVAAGSKAYIEAEADNDSSRVQNGTATVPSCVFKREDVILLNKQAKALMKGVSVCEPEIKKVQNSLRRLVAMDIGLKALTFNPGVSVGVNRKKVLELFLEVRAYLNFANRYGIAVAVKASKAIANLGEQFLSHAGKEDGTGGSQNDDHSNRPKLGYAV